MSELTVSVRVAHPDDRWSLGTWIDLDKFDDYETFMDEVNSVTRFGPDDAGEIVITDTEAPWSDEVVSFPDIWERYELLRDAFDWEALAAYLGYHDDWSPSMVEDFEDAYCGLWDDLEEYARDFYEDVYGPFNVPGYSIAVNVHEWEMDHFTVPAGRGEYVFRSV